MMFELNNQLIGRGKCSTMRRSLRELAPSISLESSRAKLQSSEHGASSNNISDLKFAVKINTVLEWMRLRILVLDAKCVCTLHEQLNMTEKSSTYSTWTF